MSYILSLHQRLIGAMKPELPEISSVKSVKLTVVSSSIAHVEERERVDRRMAAFGRWRHEIIGVMHYNVAIV